MGDPPMRILAVDWSGRKKYAAKHIWLAEAVDRQIVCLESGRSREELIRHLIEMSGRDRTLVVGLDFAFGMPEWYVKHCGAASAREFWRVVQSDGEDWLAHCDWPYWGHPGKPRHTNYQPLRRTEELSAGAFSTFQIGGAGAVGTGSLRGMPFLEEFASAGWSIWPFIMSGFPMAIEIYPRLLTGGIKKSCKVCRECYLNERYPELTREMFVLASSTEDAFDAAVSALVMAEHASSFRDLPSAPDEVENVEGRIWSVPCVKWVFTRKCLLHR